MKYGALTYYYYCSTSTCRWSGSTNYRISCHNKKTYWN